MYIDVPCGQSDYGNIMIRSNVIYNAAHSSMFSGFVVRKFYLINSKFISYFVEIFFQDILILRKNYHFFQNLSYIP